MVTLTKVITNAQTGKKTTTSFNRTTFSSGTLPTNSTVDLKEVKKAVDYMKLQGWI